MVLRNATQEEAVRVDISKANTYNAVLVFECDHLSDLIVTDVSG